MPAPEAAVVTSSGRLADRIGKISAALARLDPGPLAELRRMDAATEDYGAPYFWRLVARSDLNLSQKREQDWARIVQVLAILTPKGRDENKRSRHAATVRDDPVDENEIAAAAEAVGRVHPKRRGLGHVLCDGGDPGWPADPGNPRPVYSEARLAQLLGSSGPVRFDLLRRAARQLAARLPADATFDCTDIARLLLYPDDPESGRRIARDYYARLDGATYQEAGDPAEPAIGDDE